MNYKINHFTLRQQQLAFAVCCGMPDEVVADALGLADTSVKTMITALLKFTGCGNRVEFAVNFNAAVRHRFKENAIQVGVALANAQPKPN